MNRHDREQRDRRVVALTRAGWTAPRIAEEVGMSIRGVQQVRQRTGASRPAPRRLTPDEIARAETMLADGASVAEIERTLGRRPGALTRRFAGRGWSHAECGKYAMMVRYARTAKYELENV